MPDIVPQPLKGVAPQPYPCFYRILVCTLIGPSSGAHSHHSIISICVVAKKNSTNLNKNQHTESRFPCGSPISFPASAS